jgi:hypothetical protein
MTTPAQRSRSVLAARQLLVDLANGRITKQQAKVEANAILRHFLWPCDLFQMANNCPDLFESVDFKDKFIR